MTDYVKSTNFASKDSLAIGNPLKIVKGTEIDTEFNNIATAVATKADLNSPALIGSPTAPTASAGNNTTLVATTAFVSTAVTNGVTAERSATATLTNKTLASPTMTGTPVAPTASAGTNNTQVATTAFVSTAVSTKADLNSPALTGTPTAPTAAVNTNTTQVATTAYVVAQIADDAPTKTGGGASGTWGISISGNSATATTATTATNVTNALGNSQNWSNPSRSANVWYQNTTGKPIMVNIVFGSYGGGTLQVGVSTSSFSTANVTQNDIYQTNAMSAVVPNNYYYRCTGGGTWYELS